MKRTLISLTILLILAGNAALQAGQPKVDGSNPKVQTGFSSVALDELNRGALLLFDGKTFFGWEAASPAAMRPVNVSDPEIKVGGGTMRIQTELPIMLRTPILWRNDSRKALGLRIQIHAKGAKGNVRYRLLDASGRLLNEVPASSDLETVLFQTKDQYSGPALFEIAIDKSVVFESIVLYAPGNVDALKSKSGVWKPVEGNAKIVPTESGFRLSGKGQLETQQTFGDFICRCQFKSIVDPNHRDTSFCNSGLFFRCVPGSKLDGYECQINNVPNDLDRTKFLGNDTGSIFRRKAARRVTDRDNQWTSLAVLAAGPLVRTWVDGIPTVIWNDTRKADSNPRRGLRLEPGTIQLQGHDPWTNIEFRDFSLFQ